MASRRACGGRTGKGYLGLECGSEKCGDDPVTVLCPAPDRWYPTESFGSNKLCFWFPKTLVRGGSLP